MSSLRYAVEDRKADAVTHLAIARSQNTENGILGDKRIQMRKAVAKATAHFFCSYGERHQRGGAKRTRAAWMDW